MSNIVQAKDGKLLGTVASATDGKLIYTDADNSVIAGELKKVDGKWIIKVPLNWMSGKPYDGQEVRLI